jgi:hypothetical protein
MAAPIVGEKIIGMRLAWRSFRQIWPEMRASSRL